MPPKRTLTDEQCRLLGTAPDATLAAQFGVTQQTVQRTRAILGIAPCTRGNLHKFKRRHIKLLGTASDTEIARQIGIDPADVYRLRRRYCIPAFVPRVLPDGWTAREVQMLAKKSDRVVSRATGRSVAAVRQMRCLIGLHLFSGRMKNAKSSWRKRPVQGH